MWRPLFVLLLAFVASAGCSGDEAESPFSQTDAGADSSLSDAETDSGDASDDEPDPTLGGPCVDDGQCDDGLACTADSCDVERGRCRFVPDDSLCQDGLFCNGLEICDPRLGCRQGPPETCGDENSCTIDACVEETQSCVHRKRDADGDGDPDAHCGGGDCDDADPSVSSLRDEICGNGKDDNCNGVIDEEPCVSPAHDDCADALRIAAPGSYLLSTLAASHDHSLSCSPSGAGVRDVVAIIEVPDGPSRDLDIVARAPRGEIAIGLSEVCGQLETEIACAAEARAPNGDSLARMRARELPPGSYPLYVFADRDTDITLRVSFLEPSSKPENETCGTALPIASGVPIHVPVIDAARDLGSVCHAKLGELVYAFELSEPSDVRIRASSKDGLGLPIVSLRNEACALPEDEISCRLAEPLVLYERALEAGLYYVAVSATAPSDLELTVDLEAPTEPPHDEGCEDAPILPHNRTIAVSLAGHVDAVKTGCSAGFVDAAYALDLDEPSDVLLVQRISQGDIGAVQLARSACATIDDLLSCGMASQSPVRASARKVPAGSYRAIAESQLGGDATLTAFVRPYTPPTLVAFADSCADAIAIPESGGFFQGNTANAEADLPAGCDYGASSPNGAPDQLLRLDLSEPKRVVFDMSGSAYPTLLNLRKGPSCPGTEMPASCSVGVSAARSYLDRILDTGTYFIQVDGYAGASGAWFLDIRIVDP